MEGRVFDIQRFSVHDGPGIRTTVFMKGCNLRCRWCHNPESYLARKQIRFVGEKCVACGACKAVCPRGIFIQDKKRINEEQCCVCEACTKVCIFGGVECIGKDITPEEIMTIARKDYRYYLNSGGGLTVSGGEPLLQPLFVAELMKLARQEDIHTALDTAGNVAFSSFEVVLPYTDLILYDLKCMDPVIHQRYTGVSNHIIVNNLKQLLTGDIPVCIRIPLVKGINDSVENALAVRELLDEYDKNGMVKEVRLLLYHSLGISKAAEIGIQQTEFSPPDMETVQPLQEIVDRGRIGKEKRV